MVSMEMVSMRSAHLFDFILLHFIIVSSIATIGALDKSKLQLQSVVETWKHELWPVDGCKFNALLASSNWRTFVTCTLASFYCVFYTEANIKYTTGPLDRNVKHLHPVCCRDCRVVRVMWLQQSLILICLEHRCI